MLNFTISLSLKMIAKAKETIVQDEVITTQKLASTVIDFSKYDVEAFHGVDDPVAWQKELRNEWDR